MQQSFPFFIRLNSKAIAVRFYFLPLWAKICPTFVGIRQRSVKVTRRHWAASKWCEVRGWCTWQSGYITSCCRSVVTKENVQTEINLTHVHIMLHLEAKCQPTRITPPLCPGLEECRLHSLHTVKPMLTMSTAETFPCATTGWIFQQVHKKIFLFRFSTIRLHFMVIQCLTWASQCLQCLIIFFQTTDDQNAKMSPLSCAPISLQCNPKEEKHTSLHTTCYSRSCNITTAKFYCTQNEHKHTTLQQSTSREPRILISQSMPCGKYVSGSWYGAIIEKQSWQQQEMGEKKIRVLLPCKTTSQTNTRWKTKQDDNQYITHSNKQPFAGNTSALLRSSRVDAQNVDRSDAKLFPSPFAVKGLGLRTAWVPRDDVKFKV